MNKTCVRACVRVCVCVCARACVCAYRDKKCVMQWNSVVCICPYCVMYCVMYISGTGLTKKAFKTGNIDACKAFTIRVRDAICLYMCVYVSGERERGRGDPLMTLSPLNRGDDACDA